MSTQKYLISGATGDTGRHTALSLLERGLSVRAFVHTLDERADVLRKAGAEIVQGDLLDIDSVRTALDGMAGAYFVYPLRPGLLDATAYFAQAAKEAGTPVVVNMSQISARREAASNAARNHWIGERILEWSGVPAVHVRPTYFAEWLLYPHVRAGIRDEGAIKLPFGEGRHAPIAAEDQGRTIAAILAAPSHHVGKTHVLNGPVELDEYGIAAAVSETLGKPVRYEPISIEEYRQRLADGGLWPYLIQHLVEVGIDCRNGIFEGTDRFIEQLTGTAPMTVQAFVEKHRAAFD